MIINTTKIVVNAAILFFITSLYLTNQAEASQIFSDDFETGNLDNWTETSTGTGNDVAINSNSPLFGVYDIKVTANSQAGNAFLASTHSSSYTDYYVRLYVTVPSTFSMASGDLFLVAALRVSTGAKIRASIGFGRSATSGVYQIQYRATNDAGANIFATTENLDFNDGSTHYFEIYYKAAASDPTSGGGAEFKRDGVSKASDFVSNDTDDSAIDELYVGASGLEATTDGTFQIDQILALTDQYPGAFPGTLTSATVTPASTDAAAKGNVSVTFTMANPIPANGDIQITFPTTLGSGFDLSGIGSSDVSEASSNGGTLTASVSSNVLTITCGSAINAETAMNLTIQNVRNPPSDGSTGTYSLKSQDANDYQIDSATATASTITANTQMVSVSTTVSPLTVSVGEAISYNIGLQNNTSSTLANVKVLVSLPPGFAYRSGSSTLDGGALTEPSGTGTRTLTFTISNLAGSTTSRLKFQASVGSNIEPGNYQTSVYAQVE